MREDRRLAPSRLHSADVHAELQRQLTPTELIQHIVKRRIYGLVYLNERIRKQRAPRANY